MEMVRKWLAVGAVLLASGVGPARAHEWTPPGPCGVEVDRGEAFPGAEGFGATTAGGRCGAAVVVSDLGDDPANPAVGTLRWAIEELSGARTITFSHNGIITLLEPIVFSGDDDSHLTIAGETAPGGGIVIAEFGFHLRDVHDVTFRFLRFRNIRAFERPMPGFPTNGDGIEMESVERIVIDHCSVAWATDEGFGAERPTGGLTAESHDITIQNSYAAETLWNGDHLFGANPHSRGMIFSDGTFGVSIHHNLLLSNNQRNPSLQGPEPGVQCQAPTLMEDIFDTRWNLVFNYGNDDDPGGLTEGKGIHFGQGAQANVVENVIRQGPDTVSLLDPPVPGHPMEGDDPCPLGTVIHLTAKCRVERDETGFEDFNCPPDPQEDDMVGSREDITFQGTEFEAPTVTEGEDFLTYVLNQAGALPHDFWDEKFLRDYQTYLGDLGAVPEGCLDGLECGTTHTDIELELGDHPPTPGTPWTDSDGDGIDDAWEQAQPCCCYAVLHDDSLEDCNGDDYTDLENYLHARAAELEGLVLFADEFEDRVLPANWTIDSGTWTEENGRFVGVRSGAAARAVADPAFAGCDVCSVRTILRAENVNPSDNTAHVALLGWYEDANNHVSAMLEINRDRLAVEQRIDGGVGWRGWFSVTLDEGVDYDVRLEYRDGQGYFWDLKPADAEAWLLSNGGIGLQKFGTLAVGGLQSDVEVGRVDAGRALE